MKNYKNAFSQLWIVAILLFAGTISCTKGDSNVESSNDPVIGVWNLKVLIADGQPVDVSNNACMKQTKLTVTNKTMQLIFFAPDNNNCQQATETLDWVKENEKYYFIQNGTKEESGIALNDNNRTLQLPVAISATNTIGLVFTKQ